MIKRKRRKRETLKSNVYYNSVLFCSTIKLRLTSLRQTTKAIANRNSGILSGSDIPTIFATEALHTYMHIKSRTRSTASHDGSTHPTLAVIMAIPAFNNSM